MIEIYVLDSNFNSIGVIDDYTSLIWATRYNSIGDCELYIPATQKALQILVKGNYLSRPDDDMICKIEKIELDTDAENGNYLIVTGYDIKKILNQRIVWKQTNFNGLVENFIRKLIVDNFISPDDVDRKISNFRLGESNNFTETIEEQVSFDNVGKKVMELCKTFEYGYKVTLLNEATPLIVFNLYKGLDKTDFVIFSPEFENLISSNYVTDSTNFANLALVAGEGEGAERKKTSVLASRKVGSGLNRYEIFVDAKDLSTKLENGATMPAAEYFNALKTRGLENLAEHSAVTSFEGSIEPDVTFKYKEDYNLGDLVSVENEYGIGLPARITEVIEVIDENGISIEPRFEYLEV